MQQGRFAGERIRRAIQKDSPLCQEQLIAAPASRKTGALKFCHSTRRCKKASIERPSVLVGAFWSFVLAGVAPVPLISPTSPSSGDGGSLLSGGDDASLIPAPWGGSSSMMPTPRPTRRRPRTDLPTARRDFVVPENRGQELARHLQCQQPATVFREHRCHPQSHVNRDGNEPAHRSVYRPAVPSAGARTG